MKNIYELFGKIKALPGDIEEVSSVMTRLLNSVESKINNNSLFGGTSSIASEYM